MPKWAAKFQLIYLRGQCAAQEWRNWLRMHLELEAGSDASALQPSWQADGVKASPSPRSLVKIVALVPPAAKAFNARKCSLLSGL